MNRMTAKDFDQELLDLYDFYAHGKITKREFLDKAGKYAVGGMTAAALLTSFSMWMSCLSQWFTNIGWLFLMTWAPRYFTTVHKVSVEELTLLVSIPPLVGWMGMLSGGAITDAAVRSTCHW